MDYINKILEGNSGDVLKLLPDNSIDCCVTSPPYFNLRDYEMTGQIGQEETPEEFIQSLVLIFREVKRVLKSEGTIWVNIGDSYASHGGIYKTLEAQGKYNSLSAGADGPQKKNNKISGNLKAKDLIGIPWMLAFALRADGWYLRQDIIWQKPSCMPESVTDRCTKNHEYIFLLSKSSKYYFNNNAIQEEAVWDVDGTGTLKRKQRQNDNNKVQSGVTAGIRKLYPDGKLGTAFKKVDGKRNKRSVWSIVPAKFSEAHFATFPEELPAICIKAGCPVDGIVLDPFSGAGTTAVVSKKLNRNFVGIELNPKYIEISNRRFRKEFGMFEHL